MGQRLIKDFVETGEVRLVYRHFAFLGPESVRAAEASECAAEQGRFWEYHDTLYDQTERANPDSFSDDSLRRYAGFSGVNRDELMACLDSGRMRKRVEDDTSAGRRLGVDSTPTLFINGEKVIGLREFSELRDAIRAAQAAAEAP